ncbi:MAG: Fur family ferric uptake transcriptional regulator [Planctomycetota bacterium]|jgi:Fur family ferric uptake transcriptional regulator
MKHEAIRDAFEQYMREQSLRMTPQRWRIFDKVFATHDHFSAETLYAWLREEDVSAVSRATVYRTLTMLVEGGFLETFDGGSGELLYEHVMGHRHHDHLMCMDCGRIEEFFDERIEQRQEEIAKKFGFELREHEHNLRGWCRACALKRKRAEAKANADKLASESTSETAAS